jgi:hypothetical protein
MPRRTSFINTPLQRGGGAEPGNPNRFSGFQNTARFFALCETAKAVAFVTVLAVTPLKRGVNKSSLPSDTD